MSYETLNRYGAKGVPCLFISDFLGKKFEVYPLESLKEENIAYSFNQDYTFVPHTHRVKKEPVAFSVYAQKFSQVIEEIKKGNTYLLNLTQPTSIEIPLDLKTLYTCANAPYKLYYKDKFVCFSPERFIEICGDEISTFPMKGTIDASIKNATEKILGDEKEMAEHVMIVDLLRNDLSMVARDVHVKRFRYIDSIQAGEKKLLQVSSHITGVLPSDWKRYLGDIVQTLLPAGSISGTPKQKTLSLIEEIEGYERGYFTGVFGVFDGESLKSSVMIRFIEKDANGYIYKSGGGITLDSDVNAEYNELIDKIYIP